MIPPEPPPPTLRLRVDREALAGNWRALDALSGSASAGAAVKAQCYGLGVEACVPALRDAGCTRFFVAHWSEVAAVAEHVPSSSIAVLHGVINGSEIEYARASGAVPVINSIEQAQAWYESGGGTCHLMVDTGINRLGAGMDELASNAVQDLKVDMLLSHLACADEDSSRNQAQLKLFREALGRVPHKQASLANSAGIALGPEYSFDVTRPGLALYGGVPRLELASHIAPVASIQAAVLQVREIEVGDAIGYNGEFVADSPMRVATVSIGYADGFLRSRGNGACLVAGGLPCPVLGKVSMDMIVIDLKNAPDLAVGDWVDVPFDLPDAAQQSSVSQYELLTTLGRRLRPST
ncbi:MAG: alanine racemase [Pseudomonadota bacterium]